MILQLYDITYNLQVIPQAYFCSRSLLYNGSSPKPEVVNTKSQPLSRIPVALAAIPHLCYRLQDAGSQWHQFGTGFYSALLFTP